MSESLSAEELEEWRSLWEGTDNGQEGHPERMLATIDALQVENARLREQADALADALRNQGLLQNTFHGTVWHIPLLRFSQRQSAIVKLPPGRRLVRQAFTHGILSVGCLTAIVVSLQPPPHAVIRARAAVVSFTLHN